MHQLTICDTAIKQDQEGRYCLNDLHKASGGAKTHQPADFLKNASTKALIQELTQSEDSRTDPVESIRGGKTPGTYVVKELVYAYAMWISAAFQLKVIRAFDGLVNGSVSAHSFSIPKTMAEALRLAADLDEEKERLKQVIVEAMPKVEFYNAVVDGEMLLSVRRARGME